MNHGASNSPASIAAEGAAAAAAALLKPLLSGLNDSTKSLGCADFVNNGSCTKFFVTGSLGKGRCFALVKNNTVDYPVVLKEHSEFTDYIKTYCQSFDSPNTLVLSVHCQQTNSNYEVRALNLHHYFDTYQEHPVDSTGNISGTIVDQKNSSTILKPVTQNSILKFKKSNCVV